MVKGCNCDTCRNERIKKSYDKLLEALEDIAFGRIAGDYSDVRQYAREILEEGKTYLYGTDRY